MSKPFEDLRERLLRAGIAPRHVRAYLAELREHLADLAEQEGADGGDAREALARARARLGDDETLAQAMLSRRGRSLTARAPWLVLGLFSPLLMIVTMFLALAFLIVMPPLEGLVPGAVMNRIAPALVAAGNLFITPVIAALFAWMAWRQRLAPAWALAASAVALLFFLHMEFYLGTPDFKNMPPNFRLSYTLDHHARFSLNMVTIFHPRTWTMMAAQWPLVMAQYVLTLLPAAWVWRAHRRRSAT